MLLFYNTFNSVLKNSFSDEHPLVFLAGPTERISEFTQWRIDFLREYYPYDGTHFFIPEFITMSNYFKYPEGELFFKNSLRFDNKKEAIKKYNKILIMSLERRLLRKADKIVFWVDRSIEDKRYALTTNVEFGNFYSSGKCVCGSPASADNISYLKFVFESEMNQIWYYSMKDMIKSLKQELCFMEKHK